MDRKSMAGKTSRTCTAGAKIKKNYIFFKFWFEIALNGYLNNFLPESAYICLKKY